MDDVTKALERLEQKWREEADSIHVPPYDDSENSNLAIAMHCCADELATLRQSLAGQGEASTPRAAEAIDEAMVGRALAALTPPSAKGENSRD